MAAKLAWDGDKLVLEHRDGFTQGERVVAEVRTRCAGSEYDFVLLRGRDGINEVSEPYQNGADARQDCEAEVRRLLKSAGVEVA